MSRPPICRTKSPEGLGFGAERIQPGTALWDTHYPEHLQRYGFVAAQMRTGARVLDAGCGCGYGAAYLADHGAGKVVAIDVSAEALKIARERFDRPSVVWLEEDCHTLTAAEAHAPFDVICSLENLEHLAEPERFLDRALDLLGPEGVFIASTPNRGTMNRLRGVRAETTSSNPFHSRELSEDEFRELLAIRFGDVTLFYQTWDPVDRLVYEPALDALWSNPAIRFGRWLQRALRGRPIPGRVEDLLPPRGYQVLSQSPGDGLALTHIARCSAPRRGFSGPIR
jgi:SAM-dependent methyltransferase